MHTPMATRITSEVPTGAYIETGSPLPSTVTDLYAAYTYFSHSSMGDEDMELCIRGLCTSSEDKRGNGHIRYIDLSSNDLSSQSLSHLVDVPAHILCHL